MKVAEILAAVDQLRPNSYDSEQKTMWLSEVEGVVVDEIVNRAEGQDVQFAKYVYELDAEKEAILPDRFSDIYLNYIRARIEFYDDEITQYNNAMTAYQTALDAYAAWYRRTHMPKPAAKLDIWGGQKNGKVGMDDSGFHEKNNDWSFWGH